MDDLDLLLKELSVNPESSQNKSGSCIPAEGEVPAKTGEGSVFCSIYNDLPPPVAATPPTKPSCSTDELDSILEDLLGLGKKEDSVPLVKPPLKKKQSVKSTNQDEAKEDKGAIGSSKSAASDTTVSKKNDAIDDLLGGLTSDLEKIGVRTVAKGHCAFCNKNIVGKLITALGQVWHPEHFVCAACGEELSNCRFFEREGRPYCEKDYNQLFCPPCAYCKGPILQNILTALDQTWHPEHFFCAHCGGLFGSEEFLEKDGKPYCNDDFYNLFSPRCTGCGRSVRQNYLSAANGTWHPECFVCAECRQPFTDGSFMELDGRLLCSLHYHSSQGTLCGSCREPITGRCVSALGRKFHPEHFVCALCLRQLNQGVVKEERGKPYCLVCFEKLFVRQK
ncbi:leupaxin [Nelusetta ayraudi]|uniref:leupaxin n=1 Tax=Nelusetta ayraudi TaxID=303726 RepID=UPI003F718167